MDILEYQHGNDLSEKAGLPGQGDLMVTVMFSFSTLGQIEETQTEISGTDKEAQYLFYRSNEVGFSPCKIIPKIDSTIKLREVMNNEETGMSDKSKLKMYQSLKVDLEREGLI